MGALVKLAVASLLFVWWFTGDFGPLVAWGI